jgi:hypothetical protein
MFKSGAVIQNHTQRPDILAGGGFPKLFIGQWMTAIHPTL